MQRIRFIALKEFYHIMRDMRSLTIIFLMPIMMTFLFGYAIDMDVNEVILAVADLDRTADSRDLVENLYASTYFTPPDEQVDFKDPEQILRSSKAYAVLIIKPGFSEAMKGGEDYQLGLLVDGSDNNLAAAVQNYTTAAVNRYLINKLPPRMTVPGVRVSYRLMYNPDLESPRFFVPGLVAILLLMISALLTSITIARERETGTMEQLLTAPVKPVEILIGKLMPYTLLAFLDGIIVLVFARFVFSIPFAGSYLLLLGFGFLYVMTALSIGIMISSLVKTQQVAMMLAFATTMLPSVMLTGFIFAIKNMPVALQVITNIVPAKFFLIVIRGIMLKGAGLDVLAMQGVYLLIFMVILMFIAAKTFRTKVV